MSMNVFHLEWNTNIPLPIRCHSQLGSMSTFVKLFCYLGITYTPEAHSGNLNIQGLVVVFWGKGTNADDAVVPANVPSFFFFNIQISTLQKTPKFWILLGVNILGSGNWTQVTKIPKPDTYSICIMNLWLTIFFNGFWCSTIPFLITLGSFFQVNVMNAVQLRCWRIKIS